MIIKEAAHSKLRQIAYSHYRIEEKFSIPTELYDLDDSDWVTALCEI